MSTLDRFWDTRVPYRTESVRFFGGLMNSATKVLEDSTSRVSGIRGWSSGFRHPKP